MLFHSLIRKTLAGIFALGASLALLATPATAQQFDSAYTKLDATTCQDLDPSMFGGGEEDTSGYQACVGYNNMLVFVADGDLRMFVSYGADALNEISAHQTLSPFNTIHDTLEWRLKLVNGDWQPFATILRYFTDSGDGDKSQILIVTKLEPGNSCHVAYIDATLTPDANVIARQFADNEAENFNCQTDDIFMVPS